MIGSRLVPFKRGGVASRTIQATAHLPHRISYLVSHIDLKDPYDFQVTVKQEWFAILSLFIAYLLSFQNLDTFGLLNSFTSQEHWAIQTQKMQNFIYINLGQIFPYSRHFTDNLKYDQRLPVSALYKDVTRALDSKSGSLDGFSVDFDWSDWTNLGNADIIMRAYNAMHHNEDTFKKMWEAIRSDDFTRAFQNPQLSQLKHSDAWLAAFQDPPERIAMMTKKGYYEIPVARKRRLGEQALWDKYYGVGHSKHTPLSLSTLKPLKLAEDLDAVNSKYNKPVDWNLEVPDEVHVPDEDMHWDLVEEIHKLQAKQDPTPQEVKHLKVLQQCKAAGGEAFFYFPINYMENDVSRGGDHTNFPFFQSVVDQNRRWYAIHHMMRSYAKFMRRTGYQYWVFSGNAISWYFNGNNMPWDDDIDVRMSAKEMDRMAITHNATLIIEDPQDGDGIYYFSISPWYGKETRLGNHIDARFIDIRSGLYIDITCLYEAIMKTKEEILQQNHLFDYWGVEPDQREDYLSKHTVLTDKNNNWLWEEHFRDQFRTLFEGTMVHMPYHYAEVLKYSYGEDVLRNNIFNGYRYFPELGMWLSDEICDFDEEQKILDRGQAFDSKGKLTLSGACDSEVLLNRWRRIRPSVSLHRAELVLLKQGDRNHFKYSNRDMPLYWRDHYADMYNYYESNGNANI